MPVTCEWERIEPTVEYLMARAEYGRIRLDRLWVRQGEQLRCERDEQERLYFFIDARGVFSVVALGARWQYKIRPNTVVWVPAGLEHTLRNSGDASLRAIVFAGILLENESECAKKARGGPMVWNLHNIPQRNMVSFLTRTLFVGADVGAKALLLGEYQTVLPGGWVPKHIHETREEVCYVCSGSGKLHLEGEEKVVSAGEAVRIPPVSWHSVENERDDVLEYVIVQSQSANTKKEYRTTKGEIT